MKDKKFKFKKTGNKYKVLGDEAKMKNPETRKWVECVIYQSEDTGDIYVREKSDFRKKFEICEEE